MQIEAFVEMMPKVELHVHLEGSIRPETLLKLAGRYGVALPASTAAGLQEWFTFRDFDHFIEVYKTISSCIRCADDIELIARDFLAGQAEQNILYSEVTFTADTHFRNGIAFEEQMAALRRANEWAKKELGVEMRLVLDIPRMISSEDGHFTADWVLQTAGDGLVVALGLGGPEVGYPPERFSDSFRKVLAAGLPSVPHAGETEGPASIWGAINTLGARRIGHGVRCLEDARLVEVLRERQIPLEVCPTSNVCLKVVERIEAHPLPRLLAEGLYVTVNSDDPALFNASLTREFLICTQVFGMPREQLKQLTLNAARATLLPAEEKRALVERVENGFTELGV
ncbi:MAG: adenosine deaminase [Chloroflexi bacterium]|nr:adenosine deaminase [Chloroflexota bacterium]